MNLTISTSCTPRKEHIHYMHEKQKHIESMTRTIWFLIIVFPSCFNAVFVQVFFLYFVFTLAISKCYGKVRVLFFPRDNSLISRGNSHVSRVRGLVVRCLLFNPEVSCSNPWVCANFFTSIPKQKVLTFFGTMRLFGFVRLFFEIF